MFQTPFVTINNILYVANNENLTRLVKEVNY